MSVPTSYPGVYIQELASQSLSIASGNTAVPVFAVAKDAGKDGIFESALRINSWLDFEKIVDLEVANDAQKVLYVSVKAYFMNGGGYCYLVRADKLLAEVPKLNDVTLLVAAGMSWKGLGEFDAKSLQCFNDAVVQLCKPGASLFAVLDGPFEEITAFSDQVTGNYPGESFAAAYYPWLTTDWIETPIPPSAAVAGAYCTTDHERGVWKAPANVVLKGGLKPMFKVGDSLQGEFNKGKALNMIREFQANTLIWGARTLQEGDDWCYVPVRRLFNSAEKDIKKVMQTMVFEPNNQATWERVRSAIDNYLRKLWQQGGLLGNRETDAYFVHVGKGLTMTDDDIKQGKMIVNIGMAAVRPAEFIILQFSQEVNQG